MLIDTELMLGKAISMRHSAEETNNNIKEIVQDKGGNHIDMIQQKSKHGNQSMLILLWETSCCHSGNSNTEKKESLAKVNQINNHSKVENQSDSEPEFFIDDVLQSNYSGNKIWNVSLSTNGSKIVYKIDTGAEVNVISKAEFNTLNRKPKLSDTNIKLTAYNNTKIPIAGKHELSIERL